MSITEFLTDFLEPLLKKLSFEKKEIILLGDYNINLLNFDKDKSTSEFLESMLSHSFLPRIIKPTRITPRSQTLIDNIFYNELQNNILGGNIITDISDHLTQFMAVPKLFISEKKSNEPIYKRNYKKLNPKNFEKDFLRIDWPTLLAVKDIDAAYDIFLKEAIKLIDKHIPLEKVSKRKLKEKKQPWISNNMIKNIS